MKKGLLLLGTVALFLSLAIGYYNYQSVYSMVNNPKFKEHYITLLNLKMNLPQTTNIIEDTTTGSELMYNAYFVDPRLGLRGYIQIWKVPDLEGFLANSKARSTYPFTVYQQQTFEIKSLQGFKNQWVAVWSEGKAISAKEYFLRQSRDNRVLRISFMSDEEQFSKELEEITESIVASVEWN